MTNPSYPLKPVWGDESYLNAGKAEIYREKWETVPIERADTLLGFCDRSSKNIFNASFGYKGTRLIEGREHPRLAVCVSMDRTAAWADVNAFKDKSMPGYDLHT